MSHRLDGCHCMSLGLLSLIEPMFCWVSPVARPLRIQFSGAVYHVINRGTARQAIFLQEQDYEAFLKTLAEAHVLWGVEIFAYCLMSNHYRVCLRTLRGNLSRVMRHVDGLYTLA